MKGRGEGENSSVICDRERSWCERGESESESESKSDCFESESLVF